ncbi:MAG: DUF305 domain-containing protein [Pyrinomonadaceae bacterium]|nr:DUF305 domain-containing protein [Pyrinomonadaceae bacterium]
MSLSAFAQDDSSVIVQPGAPGKATKVLPSTTNAKLPPVTKADVEFMQGMIHHHQQAVDMVALMKDRTTNKKLISFGARISQTQSEEIKFMERWLTSRGQKTSMEMPKAGKMKLPKTGSMKIDKMKMPDLEKSDHNAHQMMMPGMLTPKQMKALAAAKAAEFDRLFLTGMIQHHEGALVMVDDLFKSPGAGQDLEMFTFATDVDGTQRAEIKLMQGMLKEKL